MYSCLVPGITCIHLIRYMKLPLIFNDDIIAHIAVVYPGFTMGGACYCPFALTLPPEVTDYASMSILLLMERTANF